MGNHSSRKNHRKVGKHGGTAANTLSRVEELRGPPVDSYDKLIAWLAEMAESDHVELDTSVFVSQLNRVCRGQAQGNVPNDTGFYGIGCPLDVESAVIRNAGKRAPNTRQNSTSCDSHVSHASSDVTQRNRSSTRSDDFLDPSSAWRSGASTRQNTFSDDLEEEDDTDLMNASMESLYSSTDRDSELGSILAYDAASRRSGRNCSFQNSSPLLRATLAKRLLCMKGDIMLTTLSASTGNLTTHCPTDTSGRNLFCKKSASSLDLTKPQPMIICDSVPKLVLTREENPECDIIPPLESTFVRKKLGSGPKSLSLTSGRKRQAKFQRQFSLHSDPRPLTSISAGGNVPPFLTTHAMNLPSPDKSSEEASAAAFLNDTLLDRNIADILFSVEALWPKK